MYDDEDLITKHDHEEWQNALDTLPQQEEDRGEGDNYSMESRTEIPRRVAPSNL